MTTTIGMLAIDPAKGGLQVCAAGADGADGAVPFNRLPSRARMAAVPAERPACVVAMEACATPHRLGRVAQGHGRPQRLVPAARVKPFVKRRENDRADAKAIAEAASRPAMRLVAARSVEPRGRASSIGLEPMAT